MTIAIPQRVDTVVHWRTRHPRHVKSDWDLHGHPHHYVFIENAAMARAMDHL
jgi:hypothetical protein